MSCCDNYENRNGKCEPCAIGFISAAESTCVPCPRNTFGMKCAEYCHCKLDQRCDNEMGCIKVEQTTLLTTNDTAKSEEYLVTNLTQTTLSYQEGTTNILRPIISQIKIQNHRDILNGTHPYIPRG
ncbi:uncharacterized protein LOC127713942 [Mytilus californianus]|uniref:uncharacterized protein LOC127713942 n=1 Tax=Mytilus californianus TaxID=6549 RepID=UPI0022465918|nr:uncharacterized protein LOC127713942 [Mytilus californianus]